MLGNLARGATEAIVHEAVDIIKSGFGGRTKTQKNRAKRQRQKRNRAIRRGVPVPQTTIQRDFRQGRGFVPGSNNNNRRNRARNRVQGNKSSNVNGQQDGVGIIRGGAVLKGAGQSGSVVIRSHEISIDVFASDVYKLTSILINPGSAFYSQIEAASSDWALQFRIRRLTARYVPKMFTSINSGSILQSGGLGMSFCYSVEDPAPVSLSVQLKQENSVEVTPWKTGQISYNAPVTHDPLKWYHVLSDDENPSRDIFEYYPARLEIGVEDMPTSANGQLIGRVVITAVMEYCRPKIVRPGLMVPYGTKFNFLGTVSATSPFGTLDPQISGSNRFFYIDSTQSKLMVSKLVPPGSTFQVTYSVTWASGGAHTGWSWFTDNNLKLAAITGGIYQWVFGDNTRDHMSMFIRIPDNGLATDGIVLQISSGSTPAGGSTYANCMISTFTPYDLSVFATNEVSTTQATYKQDSEDMYQKFKFRLLKELKLEKKKSDNSTPKGLSKPEKQKMIQSESSLLRDAEDLIDEFSE